MINYVLVDAFTRIPRDEALGRLARVIARAGGVIVDFATFGAQAIRLTVELCAGTLSALGDDLAAADIELFPRSAADLDGAKRMSAVRPMVALLHVALAPAEADLGFGVDEAR